MCSVQCVVHVIRFIFLAVTLSPTLITAFSGRKMDMSAPVAYTVTRVPALVGGEAELPCPLTTAVKNDRLMLVVWYIGLDPVYSYDSEQPESKAHWVEESYVGRARWLTSPTGRLQLNNVRVQDRGEYRCRVDYYKSPTANYRIALDVVELPNKPIIYDSHGNEIIGVAGPYNEGDEFRLICTVTGGHPSPRIQWMTGDIVLNSLSPSQYYGPSRYLTLVITNATRAHMDALYTCAADNTILAPSRKTTVQLELYLKPLTVEIISRELPLSVGRKSQLNCKTMGARPPAKLTWWLEGQKMDAILMETELGSNTSESQLEWMPTKQNNGKTLTCKAEHMNHYSIETKLTLNIYYMPESKIYLGAQMNPNDIEEGDDVYFVCDVDANPPAYKVVWEHNGFQFQHNPANHVIVIGSTSMAIRNVSRYHAGQYTCTASNVEGDGMSSPLHLQVIYRPLCQSMDQQIKAAALHELTTVECEVDAYPPPDTFEWILNGSVGSIKVNPDRYTTDMKQGKSMLVYSPDSEVDYGTLSCRATNLAGQQLTPCVYTLLPVTRPDPPSNCTAYNLTDNSFDLFCVPGYDGGRRCIYIAEVWIKGRSILNESSDNALWNLKISQVRKLKVKVYAVNERGRSDHLLLNIETTLKLPPRKETDIWNLKWIIVVSLVASFIAGLILCAVAVTKRIHRASDYEVPLPSLTNQDTVIQKQNSPLNTADDKNTDVILISNEAESVPDPPSYVAYTAPKNMYTTQNFHHMQTPMIPLRMHYDVENDVGRNGNNTMRLPREIVTTRTPLLSADRESCV